MAEQGHAPDFYAHAQPQPPMSPATSSSSARYHYAEIRPSSLSQQQQQRFFEQQQQTAAPPTGPPGQRRKLRRARRIWLSNSTWGLVVACLVWVLMLGGSLAALSVVDLGRPVQVGMYLFANSLLMMAMWSHLATMLTNPGTVPAQPRAQPVQHIPADQPRLLNGAWVTSCARCNCYKPERAHHCSTCGHCIRRMDHHCPCKKRGKGGGGGGRQGKRERTPLGLPRWLFSVCVCVRYMCCNGSGGKEAATVVAHAHLRPLISSARVCRVKATHGVGVVLRPLLSFPSPHSLSLLFPRPQTHTQHPAHRVNNCVGEDNQHYFVQFCVRCWP